MATLAQQIQQLEDELIQTHQREPEIKDDAAAVADGGDNDAAADNDAAVAVAADNDAAAAAATDNHHDDDNNINNGGGGEDDGNDGTPSDDDEAKPMAAAMMVDTDPAVKTAGVDIASPAALGGVRITGAMGPQSALINGVYQATSEMSGDLPVYVKVGNNAVCMEYYAPNDQWQVKSTDNKGTKFCGASCVVPVKRLPHQCPAGKWQTVVGTKFVPLSTITASLVGKEEVEAYREEQDRETARVVIGSHNVCVTGATGVKADLINGVYQPTEELCDNATVYVKMGNDNAWLEYNASTKCWQIEETEHKGTDLSWAYCAVPTKRLPQECPEGKWYVCDGSKFVTQRFVTVTLLQDDGGDDDDEVKPKAVAMKVDTDPAAAQTAGLGLASSAASGGVRITGAMGPNSVLINGVYKATSEMSGDMPVYVKVGYNDVCLEYYESSEFVNVKQWRVNATEFKGTLAPCAFCSVPAKGLPQDCLAGQWNTWIGSKHVPLPTVSVSLVSNVEIETFLAEVEREAAHEVKGTHNVRITGAKGANAGNINGVYKPTNEMCGNATVYVMVGKDDICLVYHASVKEWQVKSTENKGSLISWAYCAVPTKRLPQECPSGKWHVSDDTKFVSQPAIKVRRYS